MHAARLELVERHDLADVVLAVLLGDVLDDLVAPVHAEVDVEVGHRHALGVQEALEQQVVRDRIDVGDAQRVRDQRAGARAAARPDGDAVLLGPVDEVPDDEEVAREAHLLDDAQLEREPRAVAVGVELARRARCNSLEARARGPRRRARAKYAVGVVALGHLELRQERLAELELDVAQLADARGVLDRLGDVA